VLYLVAAAPAKATTTAAELAIALAARCTDDEPMKLLLLLQPVLSPLHVHHQRAFLLQQAFRFVDFPLPLSVFNSEVHCSRAILEHFSWPLSSVRELIGGGGGDVTFTRVRSYLNANSSPVHRAHFLLPTASVIFCHFAN